jgi:hypothetical protein
MIPPHSARWPRLAREMVAQLRAHGVCEDHTPAQPDPACPSCRDWAAVEAYQAKVAEPRASANPSWEVVARQLGARLRFQAHCPTHAEDHPGAACPFCTDRRVARRYERALGLAPIGAGLPGATLVEVVADLRERASFSGQGFS